MYCSIEYIFWQYDDSLKKKSHLLEYFIFH